MDRKGHRSDAVAAQGRGNLLSQAHPGDLLRGVSETSDLPTSLNGLVDAILEVSRQRKVLLDQLRFALQSGNDAEALRLARQLCGLLG